jgi:hypothetical protein
MKYKFIGTDGSMGYRKGKVYDLKVKRLHIGNKISAWFFGMPVNYDMVVKCDGHIDCPYTNAGFSRNWIKEMK